jgi:hypothetical protein
VLKQLSTMPWRRMEERRYRYLTLCQNKMDILWVLSYSPSEISDRHKTFPAFFFSSYACADEKIYYEKLWYFYYICFLLFYDNLKLGNNNNKKKIKYIYISETKLQYATVPRDACHSYKIRYEIGGGGGGGLLTWKERALWENKI